MAGLLGKEGDQHTGGSKTMSRNRVLWPSCLVVLVPDLQEVLLRLEPKRFPRILQHSMASFGWKVIEFKPT